MEEKMYNLKVTETQLNFIKKAIKNMPKPSCDTNKYNEYVQLMYDLDTTEPI